LEIFNQPSSFGIPGSAYGAGGVMFVTGDLKCPETTTKILPWDLASEICKRDLFN
jgi:hypothetical protein